MKQINDMVFVSKTDERFIVDVVAPGYGKNAVKISIVSDNDTDKEAFVIKARAKVSGADQKFGFFRTLGKFKTEIAVPKKYDVSKAAVTHVDGVFRVDMPIKADRLGRVLNPAEGQAIGDEAGESEE
jgi:HSP20 family molecular chaperone IbpA